MAVLIIGQNTAQASKTGEPFLGTRSGKRLFRWLELAGVKDFVLMNLSDQKTEGNAPLKMSEIRNIATSEKFRDLLGSYDKVITLGNQSKMAIELIRYLFPFLQVLHLPHPSFRNRYFNEVGKEENVIGAMASFVNGEFNACLD